MAITDLTGCTWRANDVLTGPGSSVSYSVNFQDAIGNECTEISIFDLLGSASVNYMINGSLTSVYFPPWADNCYKTITFSGGSDITNTALISWLSANGTLEEPAGELFLIKEITLNHMSDAIRNHTGDTEKETPSQMINDIKSKLQKKASGTLEINENGIYDIIFKEKVNVHLPVLDVTKTENAAGGITVTFTYI